MSDTEITERQQYWLDHIQAAQAESRSPRVAGSAVAMPDQRSCLPFRLDSHPRDVCTFYLCFLDAPTIIEQ